MSSAARHVSLTAIVSLVLAAVAACEPHASKDPGVPCLHDRECDDNLTCLPARNGISGNCLEPACSRTCQTDADCAGLRQSGKGDECFICKDVSDCKHVSTSEGGPAKTCVDRCEQVPPR